jgi:precorrin-6Y C5,15-methyltransferase (decarboxylating)
MSLALVRRAFELAEVGWEDAVVVSALDDFRRAVNVCRAHPKVAVVTGQGAGPAELGRALAPATPRAFLVCEDLGGPAERVVSCRPAEATTLAWHAPQVVIVQAATRGAEAVSWLAGPPPGPSAWALPELGTEAEARALVLARLGPGIGDLVWDIGSPGGSVAVECARFGAAAIALGRDGDSAASIRANVRAFGVRVQVAQGPPLLLFDHLPQPDAVFVHDAGPGLLEACASHALRSVVTLLHDAQAVPPLLTALEAAHFIPQAVRLVCEPAPAEGGSTDGVVVVWGWRA